MTTIVHFGIAVLLFLVTNWLGSHSRAFGYTQMSVIARVDGVPAFNFVFRVLTPVALLVVATAIAQAIGKSGVVQNLWHVGLIYVLLRLAFNYLSERWPLLSWLQQLTQGSLIILGSYGVEVIARTDSRALVPNVGGLSNELWLLMALFAYKVANGIEFSNAGTVRRKAAYLDERVTEYRHRYGRLLDALPQRRIRPLAYAILIYESFNRHRLYRWIERNVLFPLGVSRTIGVMQVASDAPITDWDSVRLGCAKVLADFEAALAEHQLSLTAEGEDMAAWLEYAVLKSTIAAYNRDDDYVSEVWHLYQELKRTHFPDEPSQLTLT